MLTLPGLGGQALSAGEPLRDHDGLIVRIDPLIPPDDYERLQTALQERAYRGRRSNASRLLRVAFCALCSSPLYATSARESASSEHLFRYYLCGEGRKSACPANRVPAEYLEKLAPRHFLSLVGNQEILERVHIAAEDANAELAAVEEAMEHLEAQYAAGTVYRGEAGAATFAAMMTRLEERRDRLAALPSTPARIEYRSTGRTFADRWQEEDEAGRRQLIVSAGFQIRIARTAIAPADVAAEAKRQGITSTTAQLRSRAANLRFMATKTTNPERLATLEAELGAVEAERQRLRGVRRYNELVSFALNEDLARRAGLAAAGKPVELPDLSEAWDEALAPLRQALNAV